MANDLAQPHAFVIDDGSSLRRAFPFQLPRGEVSSALLIAESRFELLIGF